MEMKMTRATGQSSRKKGGKLLFLASIPFLLATIIFSYVPLLGWSYAFFDYRAGFKLSDCEFVGFKHFASLFANEVLRDDLIRVLTNTFGISLLSIATSFLPMFFAILLAEMRLKAYRKVVQTVTTIPNFISWVLVYALAYAMFAVNDGVINNILLKLHLIDTPINFLASPDHVWVKMWMYSMWKGLGWNAIIYVASISSIDAELYEAASIDGAGRGKQILYITIPGLLPTFFVLLMLSVANFLNTGVDQFFVFQNAMNKESIEVLDLYVYNKGFVGTNISFSTAVGMFKSLISLTLLFVINFLSKCIRQESIF